MMPTLTYPDSPSCLYCPTPMTWLALLRPTPPPGSQENPQLTGACLVCAVIPTGFLP